jgi:hypothetical protein
VCRQHMAGVGLSTESQDVTLLILFASVSLQGLCLHVRKFVLHVPLQSDALACMGCNIDGCVND